MENHREIIRWLASIEETAAKLYDAAAGVFKDDRELSELLRHLSDEESAHRDIVLRAVEGISGHEDELPVSIDQETMREMEKPFEELSRGLERGALSSEELLGHIISIEFSEYNDIFLVPMEIFRKISPEEFFGAAREMEEHKEHIREFLLRRGSEALIRRAGQFPPVTRDRILIVEDQETNMKLLCAVLAGEGLLESATNGLDALKAIESGRPYSAVVSDIDLPGISGIELYMKAVERSPRLKSRFIFITASADSESIRFILERNMRLLRKPAPISEIRQMVRDILSSGED